MRKLISLFTIALICFSCINNTNKASEGKITEESNFPSDKLEFASFADSSTYHIANRDTMPCINITFMLEYPIATGVAGNDELLLKDFIGNCIGKEYKNQKSIDEAVKVAMKDDIKQYKIDVCGSTPESKITGEPWMNYEYYTTNKVLYNAHGILSYSCDQYTYTGGAHGLNITSCYVYDFYDNQEIGLNSIFKEDAIAEILPLIREQLLKNECAESIDIEDVYVTENFYADANGIHWVYNPYEIAPYACGAIEVTIPYSKLEKYFIENTPIKSIL
ncbi:MAG: DUF3298 and DUF4163 domain-containing protein [Bacteroidales bacterium]|nr:DUF3298 and DUF4163 domain-containing protein [Bacteroidales bacterium]